MLRTLEVLVEEDWIRSDQLEKCVTFREASSASERTVIIFSRSISAEEARSFAALLVAAAEVLEEADNSESD